MKNGILCLNLLYTLYSGIHIYYQIRDIMGGGKIRDFIKGEEKSG